MQVALEKEFRAKEELIDENRQLRAELDSKAHKIADLHAQIVQLERDSAAYQTEIKELNTKLTTTHALTVASTPITAAAAASSTSSSNAVAPVSSTTSTTATDSDHGLVVGSLSLVVSNLNSCFDYPPKYKILILMDLKFRRRRQQREPTRARQRPHRVARACQLAIRSWRNRTVSCPSRTSSARPARQPRSRSRRHLSPSWTQPHLKQHPEQRQQQRP